MQETTYDKVLRLRRAAGCQMSYDDLTSKNKWRVKVNNGQFEYFAEIDKSVTVGSDGKDFVDNRQKYCNEPISSSPETIETHDFADDSTWSFGTSNSLYVIRPTNGQVLSLRENKILFDKDLAIGANAVVMALWMAKASACPAFDDTNKTKTAFSETQTWNPGVSAGWICKSELQDALGMTKQYHLSNQEVNHHLYLDAIGVLQYLVVVHKFKSIAELKAKSKHTIQGNIIEAFFPYVKPINIRSSMGERIEVWSENDAEYTAPNSEPAKAIIFAELNDDF